jgi:DNA-binding MarR family transcriptional regulator
MLAGRPKGFGGVGRRIAGRGSCEDAAALDPLGHWLGVGRLAHPSQWVVSGTDKVVEFEQMSEQLTSDPKAEANLGYLFRLAYQRFRAALDDALQDLGLSAQEYVVLSVFETRPELSSAELARITQVTRQTMHTAVLALEGAGLLERRPKNQRVVLVRPTTRGRKTLAAATDRVRAVERTALVGLSRNDEHAVRTWLANVAATTTSIRPTAVN